MSASTPGSCLMGRADRGTDLPVRAGTFEEQRRIKDLQGGLVEDKAGAAAGLNKKNRRRPYRWDIAKARETGNDEHV